MTTRWLPGYALILFCVVAFGCNREGDSQSDNQKPKDSRTAYSKELSSIRYDVEISLTRASELIVQAQSGKPADSPRPNVVRSVPSPSVSLKESPSPEIDKSSVTKAISELKSTEQKLADLEVALRPVVGTEKSLTAIEAVKNAKNNAINFLVSFENDRDKDEKDRPDQAQLNEHLNKAKKEIKSTALTQLNLIDIPANLEEPPNWVMQILYDWGKMVGVTLGVILGLILLLIAIKTLVKFSAGKADARITNRLKPLVSKIQKQHDEFASQLANFTSDQTDLRSRIDDLELELKRVSKIARDVANDGFKRQAARTSSALTTFEDPIEKDEPVFPISIGDYLNRMQRSSNIVRPDFQNDILVSDPGGTGELVLICDAAIPDDLQPLFVVPRATQFQTKQDFYTYYQKYYECARPSSGDVWIIDPAVVSKVSGGWQLREKGVLEVR